MNKILLCGATLLSFTLSAQTTLFQDDFEAGGGNWTLNGGFGNNQWSVNNFYAGDDFAITQPTPNQPGAITGGPQSIYLHIYNTDLCGFANGCNATFDTGSTSDQSATMNSNIVTTGYNTVTLSFYYLCAGAPNVSYGTVDYSTDNGTSWTPGGTSYVNTGAWTAATMSLPAWNNQAMLKFRFRWQNGASGNDPAFAVDQVAVTGQSGSFATVTTGTVMPASWCFNNSTNVSIGFTATGTVNPGNTYTAELSNAAGSFSSPVAIGTLVSSSTGSLTINGTVPAGTPVGSGYRIRVTASDPATTGTDNGVNLTVNALPSINILANPADGIMCPGESVSLLASGAISFAWSPSAGLSTPDQAATTASPTITTQYTATGTDANGCTNTASFTVTLDDCLGIAENNQASFAVYPNPASGLVHIDWKASVQTNTAELLDYSGRVIAVIGLQNNTFSLEAYPAGTYFVRIAGNTVRVTKN